MKSKIGIILILLLVLLGCTVGIIKITGLKQENETAATKEETNVTTIRSQVYSEKLENTILLDGEVINTNSDEVSVISEELQQNETAVIKCELRENVKKGDVIFLIGDRKYCSQVEGLVVDIVQDEKSLTVSILDYDKLIIRTSLDYDYIDRISIGSEVALKKINSNDVESNQTEKIENIGYTIDNNMIDVLISNSAHYLPGTTVEFSFTYEDSIDSCYILKRMLQTDAYGVYVLVENGNVREKRTVITGREFSTTVDGVASDYVEIVSGLSEGERLVVDEIQ